MLHTSEVDALLVPRSYSARCHEQGFVSKLKILKMTISKSSIIEARRVRPRARKLRERDNMIDRANVWQFRVGQRQVDKWKRVVWSQRAEWDVGCMLCGRRRRVGINADREEGEEHESGSTQRVSRSMTKVNVMTVDALISVPPASRRAMIHA